MHRPEEVLGGADKLNMITVPDARVLRHGQRPTEPLLIRAATRSADVEPPFIVAEPAPRRKPRILPGWRRLREWVGVLVHSTGGSCGSDILETASSIASQNRGRISRSRISSLGA